jgi:hypothetical protein
VHLRTRSLSTFFALAAVIVAIAGYMVGVEARVVGSSKHTPPTAGQARAGLAGNVLIEAPRGWRTAPVAPAIPALPMVHLLAYAPGGDASQAGLLTGLGTAAVAAPLPSSFVAALGAVPAAQVLVLPQAEALRYPGLRPTRYGGRALTLYAVPSPGGQPTLLACYAPPSQAAFMRACERVVSTLRPVGSATGANLTPEPSYGAAVSVAVGDLDRTRVALRRQYAAAHGQAAAELAGKLADAFARAAAKLAALEPPIAAGQAQAALSHALLAGRDAYTALAAAATQGGAAEYEAARTRVDAAEAEASAALQAFALLGYRH